MNPPKKRIALITGYFPFHQGGAEYQALLLAEYLKPHAEVAILFRDHWQHPPRLIEKGLQLYAVTPRRIKGFDGSFIFETRQVKKILEHFRPDTIYMRSVNAYFMAAAQYAIKTPCKLVWHVAHDSEVKPFNWSRIFRHPFSLIEDALMKYSIARTDAVVCQTRYQSRLLKTNQKKKHLVIGNWHPVPPRPLKAAQTTDILWVANWKPFKQPEVFVRLAERLSHLANTRFIMAGRNKDFPALSAKAAASGILVKGELSKAEINKLFERGHILVNTSTMEGFSNTFIEAWMREVPIVSLQVDPDHVLERQNIGYCAKSFDRLVRLTKRLITDQKQRAMMGKAARHHAIRHHSLKNMDRLIPVLFGSTL